MNAHVAQQRCNCCEQCRELGARSSCAPLRRWLQENRGNLNHAVCARLHCLEVLTLLCVVQDACLQVAAARH